MVAMLQRCAAANSALTIDTASRPTANRLTTERLPNRVAVSTMPWIRRGGASPSSVVITRNTIVWMMRRR